MKRPAVAAEGWPFILGAGALFILLLLIGLTGIAVPVLILALFIVWFFRDPDRSAPEDDSLLLAPADGKVIETLPLPDGGRKVGIFLSIFDVHVNRVPLSGTVTEVSYRPGRFLAAWNTVASDENERCSVSILHERGTVRVVQVAGLIARRIICRLSPGQAVERGDRYGLIRFGSRLDAYLPRDIEVEVEVGDRVRGGESIIGRWKPTGETTTAPLQNPVVK